MGIRLLAEGGRSITIALLSSHYPIVLDVSMIVAIGPCPACKRCTVHTRVHRRMHRQIIKDRVLHQVINNRFAISRNANCVIGKCINTCSTHLSLDELREYFIDLLFHFVLPRNYLKLIYIRQASAPHFIELFFPRLMFLNMTYNRFARK